MRYHCQTPGALVIALRAADIRFLGYVFHPGPLLRPWPPLCNLRCVIWYVSYPARVVLSSDIS